MTDNNFQDSYRKRIREKLESADVEESMDPQEKFQIRDQVVKMMNDVDEMMNNIENQSGAGPSVINRDDEWKNAQKEWGKILDELQDAYMSLKQAAIYFRN